MTELITEEGGEVFEMGQEINYGIRVMNENIEGEELRMTRILGGRNKSMQSEGGVVPEPLSAASTLHSTSAPNGVAASGASAGGGIDQSSDDMDDVDDLFSDADIEMIFAEVLSTDQYSITDSHHQDESVLLNTSTAAASVVAKDGVAVDGIESENRIQMLRERLAVLRRELEATNFGEMKSQTVTCE